MGRALRIEFPGAFYHVINRGVERRVIFTRDADRRRFLSLLSKAKVRHSVEVIAYCLMPNHFHMFVRTVRGGLSSFMHELLGWYASWFNARYRRVGPLFQGRYRALLVDGDEYALKVSRYIHLNPVKADLCRDPQGYHWSSYATYLGHRGDGVTDATFLRRMVGGGRSGWTRRLKEATAGEEGRDAYDPDRDARGGAIVGGERFLALLKRARLPRMLDSSLMRLRELQMPPKEIARLFRERVNRTTSDEKLRKKLLVYALRISTPLRIRDIGGLTGMRSAPAISQTMRRLQDERREDGKLDEMLKRLDEVCRHIRKM